jgi:hypothetical protein
MRRELADVAFPEKPMLTSHSPAKQNAYKVPLECRGRRLCSLCFSVCSTAGSTAVNIANAMG